MATYNEDEHDYGEFLHYKIFYWHRQKAEDWCWARLRYRDWYTEHGGSGHPFIPISFRYEADAVAFRLSNKYDLFPVDYKSE